MGTKKERVYIRVTKAQKERLQEMALKENRSLSNFILTVVENHINKEEENMKTYKIYYDNHGKKILGIREGNKLVKEIYASRPKMKNGRYIGEWEQNNLEEIAKELESKGYTRRLDELDRTLEYANREELITVAESLKPKNWQLR